MISLDTDVVSELLRPVPDARVIEWLDAQALGKRYILTVIVAALYVGVK